MLPPDLTHREPLVDETDLDLFIKIIKPLLQPARDAVWIMAGRTRSNLGKIEKILKVHGLKSELFNVMYNSKQMQQYGHWKRMRGIGVAKTFEHWLLAFMGKTPPMHKTRQFIDAGSFLFNPCVRNVPVISPKLHAFVSKEVRDTSLANMQGTPHTEDPLEQEKATDIVATEDGLHQPQDPDGEKRFVANAAKRRQLYRQVSTEFVPWFPHDNHPAILREMCYELHRPRWVLHGTPAGGAGLNGCFEMGASVVALCCDEHHREHVRKHTLQRTVESMVNGNSVVFKDPELLALSAQLQLAQDNKKRKRDDEDPEKETKKEKKTKKKDKEDKKEKKEKKGKKEDKKEKKSSSASDSSSESSS